MRYRFKALRSAAWCLMAGPCGADVPTNRRTEQPTLGVRDSKLKSAEKGTLREAI